MTSVRKLKAWINSLPNNLRSKELHIGIDDGGLTLKVFKPDPDGKILDAYFEVGGIPEEIETPNKAI